MADKIHSFKRPKRNGYRYRKQINGRVYEKYFYGNKEQRETQYRIWAESLENDHKSRSFDGSKTWSFFSNAFLTHLRTLKDKRSGRLAYRPRTIDEYKQALNHFKAFLKPHYVNDITFADVAEFRRLSKARADKNETDYYSTNKDTACIIRALEWGMTEGLVPIFTIYPLLKSLWLSAKWSYPCCNPTKWLCLLNTAV